MVAAVDSEIDCPADSVGGGKLGLMLCKCHSKIYGKPCVCLFASFLWPKKMTQDAVAATCLKKRIYASCPVS